MWSSLGVCYEQLDNILIDKLLYYIHIVVMYYLLNILFDVHHKPKMPLSVMNELRRVETLRYTADKDVITHTY
jgi:hypothetical protein